VLDNEGWSSLYWAAYQKHASVVDLLLERGSDINEKAYDGQTVLDRAIREGDSAIAKLVLDRWGITASAGPAGESTLD
jgi:uncharacterized protein